jgi:hypothetical protein
MAILTAKELLASYNVLDADKKQNHAHHEFQAFAYRLAHDLRDMENLKIYMRLARNVERSLMERAYSYALDANTDNKGKVFFWKVKELRKEYRDIINMKNFEYEYVSVEMKSYKDELSKVIFAKKNVYGEKFFPEGNKKKVLIVNCANEALIQRLLDLGNKVFILESSKKVKKLIENKFDKIKVVGTDFLKNKFKDKSFDAILLNEFWLNVPLEQEYKFLSQASKKLKSGGNLQFLGRIFEDNQEWKKYSYQEELIKYFIKTNERSNLINKIDASLFTITDEETLPEGIVFLLKQP